MRTLGDQWIVLQKGWLNLRASGVPSLQARGSSQVYEKSKYKK